MAKRNLHDELYGDLPGLNEAFEPAGKLVAPNPKALSGELGNEIFGDIFGGKQVEKPSAPKFGKKKVRKERVAKLLKKARKGE